MHGKLKQKIALQPLASRADLRRYIAEVAARDPDSEPRVKYWRIARTTTLLLLLTFSSLQYYFFDVFLTIMALPRVTVIAASGDR